MEPVKAGTARPVNAPEVSGRAAQQAKRESKPETVTARKAPEQSPRPTTNTRGETLGRLLNASA